VNEQISIIGSGFASLSAACYLAKAGKQVTILEKNDQIGGRARQFTASGFLFDMGPSWYWMPDVFEDFFKDFGKQVSDYYELVRLDPSYQVIFSADDSWQLPADFWELQALFEREERGAGDKLAAFLEDARVKYETGMQDFVQKPAHSVWEFVDWQTLKKARRLQLLSSISKEIKNSFNNPRLIQLLEFPVLFLGAKPENTPALYSLMNYADMKLGTWYPMGGMHKIVEGMEKVARELGVEIKTSTEVKKLEIKDQQVVAVETTSGKYQADYVISGADYHHTEQQLLEKHHRNYSGQYWENRTMAPSSLIFYLGMSKKIDKLEHHNLFFDEDFNEHAREIYDIPSWPTKPLFYVCAPSKTDPAVAPEGQENLFILIPVAPGLQDDGEEIREYYYKMVMERMEKFCGEEVSKSVNYKRSYAHSNFIEDYHSYKGNAYGLANTLRQTAFLKPKIRNKHIKNLYYTGQLTTPGPGVPPSIISGKVVANELIKE
jgi:phytoene desaturase